MSPCLRPIAFVLLVGGCSAAPAQNTSSTQVLAEAPPQATHVEDAAVLAPRSLLTARFSDGSGNNYSFESESTDSAGHLHYEPVRPEQSSSGVYSGGAPADVVLSEEQNAELWQRLANLHANQAIHVQSRAMGTGAFENSGPDSAVRFVIRMGPELADFVAFVERLRP